MSETAKMAELIRLVAALAKKLARDRPDDETLRLIAEQATNLHRSVVEQDR
jgi:hypothetical protein